MTMLPGPLWLIPDPPDVFRAALPLYRKGVLDAVSDERDRQLLKWGEQHHADGTGPWRAFQGVAFSHSAKVAKAVCDAQHAAGADVWSAILLEEVFEALESTDRAKLREELVQVAAVAAAWIEDLDSREGESGPTAA